MTLDVPDLVRQRAHSFGEVGRRWLDELPDVVSHLATTWNLELGQTYTGGTAAFVAAATDSDGTRSVVKVMMPMERDAGLFDRSVLVHDLVAGRGCARLLDHDSANGALLLERLGPNLGDLAMSVPSIVDAVADTLSAFWRPAPDDQRLPTGADQAMWLADHITTTWEQLSKPCSRPVIERAVALCDERAAAFDSRDAVLVHGDAHGWNTLHDGVGCYKLVDPEGLRSEKAHDLAVPMREYNEPLLAGDTPRLVRERAERLGQRCGVDPDPIWQWGFIERVSTGLAGLHDFDDDLGLAFLEVAERCL